MFVSNENRISLLIIGPAPGAQNIKELISRD